MAYRDNEKKPLSLDEIEEMEQAELKEKKKAEKAEKRARFNPFAGMSRDGDGVDKDDEIIAEHPNLKNFFVLVGRKLNHIFTANLMLVAGNFPLFFLLFVIGGYLHINTTTPYYTMFAPLRTVVMFDPSPATAALWSIFSKQAAAPVLSTADYVLIGLSLLTVLTFGPVRVGITYIHRNLVRGEPVFLWHDFWHTVRRNLRQALIYGVMDLVIIALIVYDIMFFSLNLGGSMMLDIMFVMTLFLALLYAFMRTYIYLMIVTFDLSIFKMFKNALSFTLLGLKRNLMALVGVVLVLMFNYLLLAVYPPLGIILPMIIVPSLTILMGTYAAFPKIKEIMIDPYYAEHKDEVPNYGGADEA